MTTASLTPLANQRFMEGYSCSEAVASVFAARLDLDGDALRRAAAAFGGGIGGMA